MNIIASLHLYIIVQSMETTSIALSSNDSKFPVKAAFGGVT